MTTPDPELSTAYADYCRKKMEEAAVHKRYEDAAFYARAIWTEFQRIDRAYMVLWEQQKRPPLKAIE